METLNAVITKTKAIAGGISIVLGVAAIAYGAIARAAREAKRAVKELAEAQEEHERQMRTVRERITQKILELRATDEETFKVWKARAYELIAIGKEWKFAWAQAFAEMERAEEAAAEAAEKAEEKAKASAEAVQKLQERFEELRLEVRTPEEVLEETLAGLKQFQDELTEVGIVGEEIEEVFRRAAAAARELFEEGREKKTGLQDRLQVMRDFVARMHEELDRNAERTREQFERLRQSVRTPAEELEETLAELEALRVKLEFLGITGEDVEETLRRLAELAQEKFAAATGEVEKTSAAAQDLGMTFTSAFENAIVTGMKLRDVLRGLWQDIQRIFIREIITKPMAETLIGQFKGIFPSKPSALGNVFAGGRVQPFETGGVIGGPIAFPLVGGVGTAGEKGPEAIMPLQRTSRGELGVRAIRDGGGTVIQLSQRVVFEVHAIDSRDVDQFFEEHRHRIGSIVLQEAQGSQRFKRQLTGRN